MRIFLATIAALAVGQAFAWDDCDWSKDQEAGPFGEPTFLNITYDKTVIYGWIPAGEGPFPLLGYMHGSTGEWGMYGENLKHFASHGFVVVFPHIKSPSGDRHWWTTNTDGEYLIKAINWAVAQNVDTGSDLYQKVDTSNIVYGGHSMGATCAIKGSHSQLDDDRIKLTVTQHPGVCGPTGPPPLPATWMPNTLTELAEKHPVFFTTATNDGAFWPAPETAKHEYGCWQKATSGSSSAVSIFAQWSEAECTEDHAADPFPDGGHNCPMQIKNAGEPEMPWVLTAMKLYAMHGGSQDSKCYELIWGNNTDSLKNTTWADKIDMVDGAPKTDEFIQ